MSQIGHKFGVTGTNPFTFTFGNPDQNGYYSFYVFGFWFLVCYAATQLATQLHQRCIQVMYFFVLYK